MVQLAVDEFRQHLRGTLAGLGVPEAHADIIESHFLGNELMGKASHGVFRLPRVLKHIRDLGPGGPDIRRSVDHGSTFVVDCQQLPGVVGVTLATNAVAARAVSMPVVAAGVRNYQFGTGVVGRYVHRLAEKGFIGIAMANSYPLVAPPGGRTPMIGTNPIAIGLPAEGNPIVVDVSTSATAGGRLRLAAQEGKSIPEGLVIDADGNPSTNPADGEDGAMLALGDHKGFGLGLAVELMAGALIGADTEASAEEFGRRDGTFIMAISPNGFDASGFAGEVAAFADTVKSSALRPGSEGVRLPGEGYKVLKDPIQWPSHFEVSDDLAERLANF